MNKMVFLLFLLLTVFVIDTNGAVKSWISQSPEAWDAEWKSGTWNYLEKVPVERSRMAVIGGVYIPAYAPAGPILDIGCGEGVLVDYLNETSRKHYIGIDIAAEAIHRARKLRPESAFVISAAHEYSPKSKVAVVLFSEMLYYVDHEQILKRYEQYLLPNGIMVISIFLGNNNERPGHRHHATIKFTRDYFEVIDEITLIGTLRRSADRADKIKTLVLVVRSKVLTKYQNFS